jgi:ABC-type nitrate/sulfonate/bicarbonate transport system, permease component
MARTSPLVGLILPLAVVAAWELLVGMGAIALDFLPAPHEVLGALVEEVGSGALAAASAHTIGVTVLATALALVLGGALGLAMGLITGVRTYVSASVDVLRTIPAVALMPVAVLALGTGVRTDLVLAGYAAAWPVVLTTASGVAAVPAQLHDIARMLRYTRSTTLRKIIIPAVVPAWLVGSRLAAIVALHVTIIAEMIVTPSGLGGGLIQSLNGLNPARMWAYALACGVVGYGQGALLRRTVRLALPGSPANRDTAGVP